MSIVYRGSLSLWHPYFSRKFPVSKHFSGFILKDHPQNFNPLRCCSGWWSCPWLVKCWFFDPDIGCSSFLNGTCLPRLIWNHVSPTQTTLQPQKQQNIREKKEKTINSILNSVARITWWLCFFLHFKSSSHAKGPRAKHESARDKASYLETKVNWVFWWEEILWGLHGWVDGV